MENNLPSSSSLKANSVLMGRYRVHGVLGGGGMGTVYQARDENFPNARRMVAIKEMLTLATDEALRSSTLKTFQREANILATLSHPAIPKIFDFFVQNDRAYLVMEYINGSDLELLLGKTKELPVDKIIEWAIDLCDVLHYLHSHEPEPIVFRDMKPSNVMIDSFGKVRLIDFGIAKTFASGVKHTMIGTEGYSAPEQYKGDVSPQSDIYSLGATLHHVLTRRDPRLEPPFSFNERSIAEINPKVPKGLIAVVEHAVEFDAKKRYQTCAEMKADLEKMRFQPFNMAVAAPEQLAYQSNGDANAPTATDFFDDVAEGSGIQPKWKFKTEDEIRCSPIASGEFAYIGSYDTNMWALRLDNGELVWKTPTRGGIASSPIINEEGKTILFGSEDNSFYSLDLRTGRVSWSFETKDRIRSTPRIAHNHVFVGSDDGHIYALSMVNGRKLWSYDSNGPVRTRPFVTNELIIFGSDTGEVTALELSGKRKWSYRTKRGILSSPAVDDEGMCYIGSTDGYLYALDSSRGFSSWRFRTHGPIIASPILSANLVVFGSADGSVYAVNSNSGREKWKFTTDKPIVASAVIDRGVVYVGGTDNTFYCLDLETGKERWRFSTGGAITAAPCIAQNLILVGSMDHILYALPLVG
jgi:serine/threonine protein kinase